MNRYVRLPTILLPLTLGLAACDEGCLSETTAAPTDRMDIQCEEHSYTLSIPNGCETGGCGLIMDVHGWTMNSTYEDEGTNLAELGRNAVSRGASTPYIVVQPSEAEASWETSDDALVFSFMQNVITKYDVDPNRTHFGGFSQGAAMTYRFFCNYSLQIASFAAIAGRPMSCEAPSRPFLHIHGHEDQLATFDNAEAARDQFLDYMGAEATHTILETGALHTHHRYEGNGYLWELIEHDSNGGLTPAHCFPGGGGYFGCEGSFVTGEKIIDFYIAHPKGA